MPIPARFRLKPIARRAIAELSTLCDEIEDSTSDEAAAPLLAEWNRRAIRPFERVEFRTYYGSMTKEEFIRAALLPPAVLVDDLTYNELKEVLNALMQVELKNEADSSYYLEWLEANLPGSNVSDLIYWPNEWFGDDSLFLDANHHFKPESELTSDQILRYAMLRSGRMLKDAPEVELPYPMPEK